MNIRGRWWGLVLCGCAGAVEPGLDVTGEYLVAVEGSCVPPSPRQGYVVESLGDRVGLSHARLRAAPCVGDMEGLRWLADCSGVRYDLEFSAQGFTGTATGACVATVRGSRAD